MTRVKAKLFIINSGVSISMQMQHTFHHWHILEHIEKEA